MLAVSKDLVGRFLQELKRAGSREIGGILVGENLGDNRFRLVDFSVQHSGGNVACFIRATKPHQRFLSAFFRKTGYDYERYNYLGEWHTHPSFCARPSQTDLGQMQEIVEDPTQKALFAVLLIVRLSIADLLETHASIYMKGQSPQEVNIRAEDGRIPHHVELGT